nr:hypothetical protein [Streptomyces sp. ME08-AFT2]
MNERAAEEALTLKEAVGAEVTVVSMGPDSATPSARSSRWVPTAASTFATTDSRAPTS